MNFPHSWQEYSEKLWFHGIPIVMAHIRVCVYIYCSTKGLCVGIIPKDGDCQSFMLKFGTQVTHTNIITQHEGQCKKKKKFNLMSGQWHGRNKNKHHIKMNKMSTRMLPSSPHWGHEKSPIGRGDHDAQGSPLSTTVTPPPPPLLAYILLIHS